MDSQFRQWFECANKIISDHLGSVRAVINANGEVVERNDTIHSD